MSDPRVTLVIPVYNGADYLVQAVESVLAQTYSNLQLIVVDDGSTDMSSQILSRYTARCTLIKQVNQGQAVALNHGWEQADGDLLGYLSADDTLEPEAVTELVHLFKRHPSIVLAYPDYWLIDQHSRRLRRVYAPVFDYAALVLKCICPVGPGALFRRSAYHQAGGWDSRLRQLCDYEFLMRLGLLGPAHHLGHALASFRIHEGSQTFAASSEARTAEYHDVMQRYFARSDIPSALQAARSQAQAHAFIMMARLHFRAQRFQAGIVCLKQALQFRPGVLCQPHNLKLLMNGLLGRRLHNLRQLCMNLADKKETPL